MLEVAGSLCRNYRTKRLYVYLWTSCSRRPHLSGFGLCHLSPRPLSLVDRLANSYRGKYFSHMGKLPEDRSRTGASFFSRHGATFIYVRQESLYDSDNPITDVSSTRGMHQHETGLTDAARPKDTSVLVRTSFSLLRIRSNDATLPITDQTSRSQALHTTRRVRRL